MEGWGEYILAIIVTGLICGILSSFVPSSFKAWMQFLCGIILTITLVKPFTGLKNLDIPLIRDSIYDDGVHLSDEGKKIAQDAMADIIRQNSQAYIMDKAAEHGISIEADISVNDEDIPAPVSAAVHGNVSPYARLQVESLIEAELGIAKENIRWIP